MRNFKKRFISLVSVAALTTTALVAVPSTASANPVCTNKVILTECVGLTSDGAQYIFQVPANFGGTLFLFSHGYRYPFDIPAAIPRVGGYTVLKSPQPAPGQNAAQVVEVATALLTKGYAVGGSGFATQGWNADSGVKTNVELIGIIKKQFPTVKKVATWGESLGAFITQAVAEKNPGLVDSVGLLCPAAGSVEASLKMAGDALWGIKTFFDPTIKGGNYSAGAAGVGEALADIVKVLTVAGTLQAAFGANPTMPAWPATSKVPAAMQGAIPSRSALVLVALMSGVPTKSASFDGATGPGPASGAAAIQFAAGLSPAFGALENVTNAALLGVLATWDVENQVGGAIFDNTKTDYAAQLGDDLFTFGSALSGFDATTTMLGYLAAAPKATANAAAVTKMRALVSHKGTFSDPTVVVAGEADQVTPAGNAQWLVNKAVENYLATAKNKNSKLANTTRNNVLPLWQLTPANYTKFNGAAPVTQTTVNGTGHCVTTTKQYVAIAEMLAHAAENGSLPPIGMVKTKSRKAGGLSYDPDFSAPLLKFYNS
jgi:pimeloyl-ACP methyl ester carboxylesterase